MDAKADDLEKPLRPSISKRSSLRDQLVNPLDITKSQKRFKEMAKKKDFTSEWSLCLVVPTKENGFIADKAGEYLGKLQNQLGFQCIQYQGLRTSELYILLRIPPDQISDFADSLDYPMLLDERKLEEMALAGNAEKGIEGFAIPHKPEIARYRPYQFIYGKYDKVCCGGLSAY